MTEPSRLLAGRRGPSRQEKEAILDGVLARVAPRPRWGRRLAIGALAVAGAATVMIVVQPSAPRDELTARGGSLPAGFDVTCVPAPCTVGSKLVFDLAPTGDAAYFAAFARKDDALIWYFPSTAKGQSRAVPRGGGVLDTGIVLGPEHAPGTYVIEGVFSSEPLDRAAIRTAREHGREIITRQVIVQ